MMQTKIKINAIVLFSSLIFNLFIMKYWKRNLLIFLSLNLVIRLILFVRKIKLGIKGSQPSSQQLNSWYQSRHRMLSNYDIIAIFMKTCWIDSPFAACNQNSKLEFHNIKEEFIDKSISIWELFLCNKYDIWLHSLFRKYEYEYQCKIQFIINDN